MSDIRVHASVVVTDGTRILMVREGKPEDEGRFNLPGGHLEYGETLEDAARREALEETGLTVRLMGLLGVYTGITRSGGHSVRFVYRAEAESGVEREGEDILEVRWWSHADVAAAEDDVLTAPRMLRRIMSDVAADRTHPLTVVVDTGSQI